MDWKPTFLKALLETGHVSHAAGVAGVSRATAYDHKTADEAFGKRWDEAIKAGAERVADLYEEELARRALTGIRQPFMYEGQPVFAWFDKDGELVEGAAVEAAIKAGVKLDVHRAPVMDVRWSDGLLLAALKGLKPAKYRERVQHTHDGKLDVKSAAEAASEAAAVVAELCARLGVDPGGVGEG